MLNILLSQAGPAFTANPVKRYAGHKDGVWEVKVIHHKSLKVKKKYFCEGKRKREISPSTINQCNLCQFGQFKVAVSRLGLPILGTGSADQTAKVAKC